MSMHRMSRHSIKQDNSSGDDFEDDRDKSADDTKSFDDDRSKLTHSLLMHEIRQRIPPPNPLFPKSFFVEDESAMTGGMGKIFMLKKFKGIDRLVDLINSEGSIVTLTTIATNFKEDIVYWRNMGIDQSKALTIAEVNKNTEIFNTHKLDVKKLLNQNINFQSKKASESCVQTTGLEPFYKLKDDDDKTLIFESR